MFEDMWDSPTVTPEARDWVGSWWPADLPAPWDHEAWAEIDVAQSARGAGRQHDCEMPRTVPRAADVVAIARELSRCEPARMGDDRLVVMMQVTQRLADWALAQRLAAVGELHRRRGAARYPQPP
jgi:hypothetical protein